MIKLKYMIKSIFYFLILIPSISFSQKVDTLSVHQNDTVQFHCIGAFIQRPCSNVEFSVHYELKKPNLDTYYYIYNEKNLLAEEGIYSTLMIDNEAVPGFYNSKYYSYSKRGKLKIIFYQKDGRNIQTEYYRNGKLRKNK